MSQASQGNTAICRVCGGGSRFAFSQTVLARDVDYFDCSDCGYLQTQEPYWLDEAYSEAINDVDTGILFRNRLNVGRVVATLLVMKRLHGRVLDHAGGYGILVRALRDVGVDAYWRDKYCENRLARGFEADGSHYDLLTAFEVFEHFVNPEAELREMLKTSDTVLLSTELVPGAKTPSPGWWYFGTDHGQHVGFFRASTLSAMAARLGVHMATDGHSVHVFSTRPIPSAWRPAMTLSRVAPFVARARLRTRIITDIEVLRARK